MTKRDKNRGLIHFLIDLPWWVNGVLGCFSFVTMRWVIPAAVSANLFLMAIAKAASAIAYIPLWLCGAIAVIGLIRAHLAEQKKDYSGVVPAKKQHTSSFTENRGEASASRKPVQKKQNIQSDNVIITPYAGSPAAEPIPERPLEESLIMPLAEIPVTFTEWSIEALRILEWKRFELLTAAYYSALGFRSETVTAGADGGIDVKLFKTDPVRPVAIVQCKAWNTHAVGVKEIRELLGVMTHEKVKYGIFVTTGSYTNDALAFGHANPIQLVDGLGLLDGIQKLENYKQETLLSMAFDGDYKTPTCASCGVKMIQRNGKRGSFWGCVNYPRCKCSLSVSKSENPF